MQSYCGITPVGIEPAVCVNVDDNLGVVQVQRSLITCATCKYGNTKCHHVTHLKATISDLCAEEIPPYLEQFACQMADPSPNTFHGSVTTCLSTKKIPFDLPREMTAVFKTSTTIRFSLDDSGVSHLAPPTESNLNCGECRGCCWSRDMYLVASCFLVTMQGLFPARG